MTLIDTELLTKPEQGSLRRVGLKSMKSSVGHSRILSLNFYSQQNAKITGASYSVVIILQEGICDSCELNTEHSPWCEES